MQVAKASTLGWKFHFDQGDADHFTGWRRWRIGGRTWRPPPEASANLLKSFTRILVWNLSCLRGMTQPRMTNKGDVLDIGRRTVSRRMLLRPDEETNNVVLYTLAVKAEKFGIKLHAVCFMSNHYHLVATDTEARSPLFYQEWHLNMALALKKHLEWEENFWDSRKTAAFPISTLKGVIGKIVYTLMNPVRAGIVEHPCDWPGVKTLIEQIGAGPIEVRRPEKFFDPKNPEWPEVAQISFELPSGVTNAEEFRRMLAAEIERQVEVFRKQRIEDGQTVLGAEEAMKVEPTSVPATKAPKGKLIPKFIVGSGNPEARKEAIEKRRAFMCHYRRAMEQWRAGNRDVVFPEGTWWMRVFHHVRTVGELVV